MFNRFSGVLPSPLSLTAILIAGLLAGCSYYSGPSAGSRPGVPLYRLPPGSALILQRELRIPAHALAVYLQDGQVLPGGVSQYQPNCKFELRQKQNEPQVVTAGVFPIAHFAINRGDFASTISQSFRPVRYRLDLFDEDAPSFIVYASYFFLASAEQPEVLRLSCRHWQVWGEGRYLSLPEIQQALGEVFTLRLGLVPQPGSD